MLVCISCTSNSNEATNPQPVTRNTQPVTSTTYDLAHPSKKWSLPPELLEISGITYTDNDHLMAIEDITPNLYLLNISGDKAFIEHKIPFRDSTPGKKFDVEDIAVVNSTAYALWSHGTVFKITNWQSAPKVQEVRTVLSKENNTEGMCYDAEDHVLLIACKNESDLADEKRSTRAIYAYDLAGDSLKAEPFMVIHKEDLKNVTGDKIKFYPSAIAVHPLTHDIYILSTKDTKCMAIFSHSGQLKSVELIDKELMPQPEGICFSPNGNLFISTEGKVGGEGAVLRFDAN